MCLIAGMPLEDRDNYSVYAAVCVDNRGNNIGDILGGSLIECAGDLFSFHARLSVLLASTDTPL
jgi:hypothetical protein